MKFKQNIVLKTTFMSWNYISLFLFSFETQFEVHINDPEQVFEWDRSDTG